LAIIRPKRKIDHVKHALQQVDSGQAGFSDITLIPEAVPDLKLERVDCTCSFMGKNLSAPLLINAMTGGHPEVKEINAGLAEAASVTGIAMAVGSQRAALEDSGVSDTYAVVREKNSGGVILANLNAGCSYDDALRAVEMLRADGIQLYLNAAQELSMAEGDVDFRGIIDNIAYLVDKLPVPVIVKEVGFGISGETVRSLTGAGVKYIDIGGRGGTNFAAIERGRQGKSEGPLLNWGIPTAASLLEALAAAGDAEIIASGGVRSPGDVAKALVAGVGMVGLAKPFLLVLTKNGVPGLVDYIEGMKLDLRTIMMALGVGSVNLMKTKPMVITGFTAEWMQRRGVDVNRFARR